MFCTTFVFCFVLFCFQVVEDGYEFFARRHLVTLFSAPNYCGEFDNAGAMMSVDDTLMCSFQVKPDGPIGVASGGGTVACARSYFHSVSTFDILYFSLERHLQDRTQVRHCRTEVLYGDVVSRFFSSVLVFLLTPALVHTLGRVTIKKKSADTASLLVK